jgi:hypothetical protein
VQKIQVLHRQKPPSDDVRFAGDGRCDRSATWHRVWGCRRRPCPARSAISPQFTEATRRRIQAAAMSAGYRPNSLVGRVMSEVRRSRSRDFRGSIAALNAVEPPNAGRDRFHQKIPAGRGPPWAAVWVPHRDVSDRTGCALLETHQLRPALAQHSRRDRHCRLKRRRTGRSWSGRGSRLCACSIPMSQPRLHSIGPDHHAMLLDLLDRLTAQGHRRIGLFLKRSSESRLRHRWSAAFHVFCREPAGSGTHPASRDGAAGFRGFP